MMAKEDHANVLHKIAPESPPAADADAVAGGTKTDTGKAPVATMFMRYFPRAIVAVAYVSEYGARKYAPQGFRHMENVEDRTADAGLRHLLDHYMGEPYDQETSMAHLAHHAWNAMCALEMALTNQVIEVRKGDLTPAEKQAQADHS